MRHGVDHSPLVYTSIFSNGGRGHQWLIESWLPRDSDRGQDGADTDTGGMETGYSIGSLVESPVGHPSRLVTKGEAVEKPLNSCLWF